MTTPFRMFPDKQGEKTAPQSVNEVIVENWSSIATALDGLRAALDDLERQLVKALRSQKS